MAAAAGGTAWSYYPSPIANSTSCQPDFPVRPAQSAPHLAVGRKDGEKETETNTEHTRAPTPVPSPGPPRRSPRIT